MTAEPALRLEGVVKRYGAAVAVDGVSFAIAPGSFTVLLGPSGAGKSTIFRCISRLVVPDAGHINLLGRRMDALGGRALRSQRRSIGLIFQQFNLIGRMSALDNVLAGRLGHVAAWRAMTRAFTREDRQRALAALDRVGLLDKAYQRADSLSGGQQQRVAIARVLAQQSRIILADEPVASLDPAAAENVLDTLSAIARECDIAVLCSLHQTAFALRYAERIIALRAGRVVFDVPTAGLRREDVEGVYSEPGPPPSTRRTRPGLPALAPLG